MMSRWITGNDIQIQSLHIPGENLHTTCTWYNHRVASSNANAKFILLLFQSMGWKSVVWHEAADEKFLSVASSRSGAQ